MQVKNDNEICGLTFTFVETFSCELVCKLCKLPCKNPQISLCCKNNFCEGHLKNTSNVLTQNKCPICFSEKFDAFPDSQTNEKIQALLVYCPNKDVGCTWVGRLSQVDAHCDGGDLGCPYQEIQCPSKCGVSIRCKDLESHLMANCPCYCQYCKTTGDEVFITDQHKEKCPKFTVQCPNGCGVTMFQENINEHCKVCPLEKIQCEYYRLGCSDVILRKNKEQHKIDNVIQHLDLMKKNISDTSAKRICSTYLFPFILTTAFLAFSIIQNSYFEVKCQEIEATNHKIALKYHEMENGLNQQLKKLKRENEKLKRDQHQFMNIIFTWLIDLEIRVYEYATSEELQYFENLTEAISNHTIKAADKCRKAADKSRKQTNKLTKEFGNFTSRMDNLSAQIDRNSKDFNSVSVKIDQSYKKIMSDYWLIHLSILHLLALHGNQIVPVVLVISNYSEWVKEKETWYSPFFLNARNGSQFCLSVKPVETELFIALHLLRKVRESGLHDGIFVIEVLNLFSDDNHSLGKIHFNETTSSVPKTANDTNLFGKNIVGNLHHVIPRHQENITYILRDELFLRVSFYGDK